MAGLSFRARWAVWGLLWCSLSAGAASVSFQQRNYDVSIIPLATNVPGAAGCDLIFVILPSNQKYLCIPTDANARACFDPNVQRFYRVDRANGGGVINGFSALASTLINTDGTLFKANIPETPALNGATQSSLESYTIPLDVNANVTADIAILDDATIAYRSAETKIYEISRDPTSFTKKTTTINSPALVAPGNVAVDYDIEDGTLLLVEPVVNDSSGNLLPDRISSYFRDGTKFDEIILDNNTAIPGYNGNASGIAWDVDNGDIYVLDSNQLIYFKLLRATLTSVTPNHGPAAGNINVTIAGSAIPPDAIVFFDGIQASNIVVNSSSSITCTVPPHALGAVDITMTGTGIVPGSPVTLTAGFTYMNQPPVAVLSASPTQGPEPLTVNFDITGSLDPDGTLTSRIIDFGDGNVYAFPADISIVTVSHTYPTNGTFSATLTVTDNSNATATASKLIIVGTGGVDITDVLVLKTLALRIAPTAQVPPKDQIKMTGLVVLPTGVTPASLSGGTVTITVNSVTVSSIAPTVLTFGAKGIAIAASEKFTLKLENKPGYAPGTYSITYVRTKTGLTGVTPAVTEGRAQIPIEVKIATPLGRMLSYEKTGTNQAVVQVKSAGKGSMVTLVRK
ncbi:MAG TPA: PKD domain-containing protein [Planctomycetota bacterium]|nr:PKD domain-containing protein [Planctomycetota bacterium]